MTNQEFIARKYADAIEAYQAEENPGYTARSYDDLEPWKRDIADSVAKYVLTVWPDITAGIPNAA